MTVSCVDLRIRNARHCTPAAVLPCAFTGWATDITLKSFASYFGARRVRARVGAQEDGMAVDDKVKQIVSEQLGVDEGEVTPSASFVDDLGADSLDVVELVMAFEEAFDIEIPDEDAEKIKTVQDAIDYIDKKAKVSREAAHSDSHTTAKNFAR